MIEVKKIRSLNRVEYPKTYAMLHGYLEVEHSNYEAGGVKVARITV